MIENSSFVLLIIMGICLTLSKGININFKKPVINFNITVKNSEIKGKNNIKK